MKTETERESYKPIDPPWTQRDYLQHRIAILQAAAILRATGNYTTNEAVDIAIQMLERTKSKGY